MRYRNVCIEATGYYLPEEVLTSVALEERLSSLVQRLELKPGFIENITGVRERRVWPPGTRPSTLAATAGERALVNAKVAPEEVDLLIYTGVCRDALEPATASVVANNLGLSRHCQVFDISNACLGFLNAMTVAAGMIELGHIKTALLVSGENAGPLYEDTISTLQQSPEQFRSRFAGLTLGSGAVGFVLQHRDLSKDGHFLLGGLSQADPSSHDLCYGHGDIHHLSMTTDTEKLTERGLNLSEITWSLFKDYLAWGQDDADHILSHQVSRSHHKKVFSRLGLDPVKGYSDLDRLGNTGTVAAPLSLALREEAGKFKRGEKLALLGIGSGLNCLMLGVIW